MDARLAALAAMVPAGARLADIGTDHAYLPIALVQAGKVPFAIASDIAAGPLANAQADIQAAGLTKQIETRLGNGLTTIKASDQIDAVVIAGIGGQLMTEILSQSQLRFPTLILEPNIGEREVRRWLEAARYQITAEHLLWVKGHSYELIKAELTAARHPLTEREALFGPLILQDKNNPAFARKWKGQLDYDQRLLQNLQRAKQPDQTKIARLSEQIKLIKGELHD
ncbi:MAG: class I SAM-dependent methyltransferase [Lactobacillus sp.]|jgi:tRNA (adenine22-N1)-methyltransferase|nr:class I SAM-dependent methyltransferase [Lactobacillus sp.]